MTKFAKFFMVLAVAMSLVEFSDGASTRPGSSNVTLKTLRKTYHIKINPHSTTVLELKKMITDQTGESMENKRLLSYDMKELDDKSLVSDYYVDSQIPIHCVERIQHGQVQAMREAAAAQRMHSIRIFGSNGEARIEVEEGATFAQVKQAIQDKTGMPIESQDLKIRPQDTDVCPAQQDVFLGVKIDR
jgi:hypothetical protein